MKIAFYHSFDALGFVSQQQTLEMQFPKAFFALEIRKFELMRVIFPIDSMIRQENKNHPQH